MSPFAFEASSRFQAPSICAEGVLPVLPPISVSSKLPDFSVDLSAGSLRGSTLVGSPPRAIADSVSRASKDVVPDTSTDVVLGVFGPTASTDVVLGVSARTAPRDVVPRASIASLQPPTSSAPEITALSTGSAFQTVVAEDTDVEAEPRSSSTDAGPTSTPIARPTFTLIDAQESSISTDSQSIIAPPPAMPSAQQKKLHRRLSEDCAMLGLKCNLLGLKRNSLVYKHDL
ncbi:hypothetical protein BDV98DRAFT_607325 [Pterulicium gracile]|uniref:Uncharacterized protein n=1 Tax=Pterulicium gracile TaxID=1884261 RepID=A0A5C3Q6Z4_9AGAR|nr:hypothetical protein BDV98DRAFT_607325 [Pterula gracilis]